MAKKTNKQNVEYGACTRKLDEIAGDVAAARALIDRVAVLTMKLQGTEKGRPRKDLIITTRGISSLNIAHERMQGMIASVRGSIRELEAEVASCR